MSRKAPRPLPPLPRQRRSDDDGYLTPVQLGNTYATIGTPEDSMIEVQNLPRDVTEEDLILYFENRRKFGTLSSGVSTVDISADSKSAIITFGSVDDAAIVLQKHESNPCVLNKKTLNIKPFRRSRENIDSGTHYRDGQNTDKPDGRGSQTFSASVNEEVMSDAYLTHTDTIEVQGFKSDCTEDGLRYYFENERRSGGGEIVSFNLCRQKEFLLIKFHNRRVVNSVLSRDHKVEGCVLRVRPFIISQTQLLLQEIPHEVTDEQLTNFLEARLKIEVLSVDFDSDNSKALVNFAKPFDFSKAVEMCKNYQINHMNMIPLQVPETSSIVVTDLPKDATESGISLYFENTRRSNGGDVTKTELSPNNEYCVLTFREVGAVSRVCQKTDHQILGCHVKVQPYIAMFGLPRGCEGIKLPKPVVLDKFDKYKLKFLKMNKKRRIKLDEELKACSAEMIWDDTPISIECSLDESEAHRSLVQSWSDKVVEIVERFVNALKVKSIGVEKSMFDEALNELGKVNVPNSESVSVFPDKSQCLFSMVGDKEMFGESWKKVEDSINEVKVNVKRKKESVVKTKELQKWKLNFLVVNGFIKNCESRFENMKVEISIETGKITFTGKKVDVDEALINMFELLQNIRPYTVKIGMENGKLLQNETVQNRIKEVLKEEGIIYVWDFKGDKLIIYCLEDNHISEIESVIWKNLTKITIPLDAGSKDAMQSEKWKTTKRSLQQKFRGCIEFKEHDRQLEIYTTDSLQDQVSDELHKFLAINSVYKEQMSLKPEIVKYIMQVRRNVFEREKKNLKERGLNHVDLDEAGGAVTLEGTSEGIRAGKRMIQNLRDDIVVKQHCIECELIGRYLACEKGKECIKKVEKQTPCHIDIGKPGLNKSYGEKKGTPARFDKVTCCAEATHSTGIKLKVFGGDITDMRVDVLVNAANKELRHSGGLAKLIHNKGGKVIEVECNERIKKEGQLYCGDVFVSNAGNLPCKFVAHAAGPNWDGGKHGEEKLLKATVDKCLKKTVKRGQRSIAFPALCTGIYQYPVDKACTTIISAVNTYLENKQTGLKEVIFCDINSRTVNAFVQALQSEFSDAKLLMNVPQQPDSEPSRMSRDQKPASVNKFGKVQVKVVKAILVKERVDVIVNSTSDDLDLKKGASSNAILRAAGDDIQDECNSDYPNGIQLGDVAVTSGGNLKCSHVFHIAVKSFDSSHPSRSLQGINRCMIACLEEASSKNLSTISFPAIGTGAQKYPKDRVAKQMFKSVSNFVKDNPRTSLRCVRFVIYTADDDTFGAFLSEEKNWNEDGGDDRSSLSSSWGKPLGQLVKDGRGHAEFSIGSGKLLVYQGDITEEDTDAIVASGNMDLDLHRGAVTKALLKKGGKAIEKECETHRSTMRKKGIVITTAGQLPSQHIVHVDTKRKPWEWRVVIASALTEAEKHQFSSVAFPALGTSVGCKPRDMAVVMCEMMSEFMNAGPMYTNEVRLVIFQRDMVVEFIEGCKSAVKGRTSSGRDEGRHRSHDSYLHKQEKQLKANAEDSQIVTIYAESEEKATRAVKVLEKTIKDEWMIKTIEDPGICGLSSSYIQQMKKASATFQVEMKINTELGMIHLVGLSTNVLHVYTEVISQLRTAEKSVYKKRQAQLMSNIVRWMYLKNHKSFPFLDKVNLEIETAYRNKQKNVRIKCGVAGEIEIDFDNMVETDVNNPKNTFQVIRRDLLNDVSAELPKHWAPMKDDENLKLISLNQQHKEYTNVVQDFQRTLGRVPNIVKIERIQNRTLYTQFAAKHKLLDQTYPQNKNERILWHGTAQNAVQSINAQGFNRSYCGKNAVAIGNGVYFAVNANYSDQGTYTPLGNDGNKRMYRCKVLTGKYCIGAYGMRVPPPIDQSSPHILYDSVTNDQSNPCMFVIFNDTQAYPEYIITYK